MESPKKQTSLSWDEIVRRAREETPPRIDARPAVRARLESELRLASNAYASSYEPGLLEGIVDLFSRKTARISLGACLGAAAMMAVATTSAVDVSELTEGEADSVEEFSEVLVIEDLALYL